MSVPNDRSKPSDIREKVEKLQRRFHLIDFYVDTFTRVIELELEDSRKPESIWQWPYYVRLVAGSTPDGHVGMPIDTCDELAFQLFDIYTEEKECRPELTSNTASS
jgi:hypothetical protein